PPRGAKLGSAEPSALGRQRQVSRTALARVLVDENGRAEQVEVYRDTSPKVGYGEASARAVKQWEWTPATKDGVPVKTWYIVPLPFVLK
nr:energy transducer TonB [Thermoanaerobaculia bacterium]